MPRTPWPSNRTKWGRTGVLVLFALLVCAVGFRILHADVDEDYRIAAILTMSVNLSAYAGVLMFAAQRWPLRHWRLHLRKSNPARAAGPRGAPGRDGHVRHRWLGHHHRSLRLRESISRLAHAHRHLILSAIFVNLTWLTAGPRRNVQEIPPPVFWVPGIGGDRLRWSICDLSGPRGSCRLLMARGGCLGYQGGNYLEAIRHDDTLSATLGIIS